MGGQTCTEQSASVCRSRHAVQGSHQGQVRDKELGGGGGTLVLEQCFGLLLMVCSPGLTLRTSKGCRKGKGVGERGVLVQVLPIACSPGLTSRTNMGFKKKKGWGQGWTCARTKRFGLPLMAHSPGLTSRTSKRCRIRKDGGPNRNRYRMVGGGGGIQKGGDEFVQELSALVCRSWYAVQGLH